MKFYKKTLMVSILVTILSVGCKKLDTIIGNPNVVDPSQANVDLLLNGVQVNFVSVFNNLSDFGQAVTRQQAMTGGSLYNNAYSPTSFDGTWTNAYAGVIKNVNALIPLALKQKKYVQAGIAQVSKAYVLGSLVDFFGDVPDKEAALGQENLNPKADLGVEVYKTIFTLLDSAVSNFTKTGGVAGPTNDIFFQGNTAKWKKAAKTLKLKFLLQTRLVDNTVTGKVQNLLTENDLITSEANDFVFKFGTSNNTPDSRHPHYGANYNNASTGSNSANDFIGNYFMWAVCIEKTGGTTITNLDPRRRYYFYRQRANNADANSSTCPCTKQLPPSHYGLDQPFCILDQGYWGRDHGDNTGTPPDGPLRTTWGVYPAAGQFDAPDQDPTSLTFGQNISVNNTKGGKGAGINPIFLSSFTYFVEAEAALKLNITTVGTPKSLLEKGVRASIEKVLAFPSKVNETVPAIYVPSAATINTYVNTVLARYDAATTDAARLDVIIKEYYIASWGNGIEPYNNYRRTGSPNNMQLTVTTPNSGFFIRSFFYPSVYINRNINAPAQKNPGVTVNKVFWDNNPDNFIK